MQPTAEARSLIREAGLDSDAVEEVARRALDEDLAGGVDVTTEATVAATHESTGDVVARADGVVAGIPVAAAVFALRLGGSGHIEALRRDGERVANGEPVLTVSGPTRELLTAERCALNLLSHLSGVATLTRRWADAVASTGAVVRDKIGRAHV